MSADAINVILQFPKIIWRLFTGFTIPGLNFTPAVLFFGILSFSLAFKFIMSILNVSTSGFNMQVRRDRNVDVHAAAFRRSSNRAQ